jgi:hypothetical protein
MAITQFSLKDINELLEYIKAKEEPFWGETAQEWQDGKIVLWRESGTKKPKGGDRGN